MKHVLTAISIATLLFAACSKPHSPNHPNTNSPASSSLLPKSTQKKDFGKLWGHNLEDVVEGLGDPDLRRLINAEANNLLTTRRPYLELAHTYYSFVRDAVNTPYQDAGLPEEFAFGLHFTESQMIAGIHSRVGAAGISQLMPVTARHYGLEVNKELDERLIIDKAIPTGIKFLEDLQRSFPNKPYTILAAWNLGETKLRRVMRRAQSHDFVKYYAHLPRETREFVPRVLAATKIRMYPDKYKINFSKIDTKSSAIMLRSEATIGMISMCLGGRPGEHWFRILRNANDAINPRTMLPSGSSIQMPIKLQAKYLLECSSPQQLAFARELHDAEFPSVREYIVRPGDALYKIAARNAVSIATIRKENSIKGDIIHPGQIILLPSP